MTLGSYQNNGVRRDAAAFVETKDKCEDDEDAHHPARDCGSKKKLQNFVRECFLFLICTWSVNLFKL